MRKTWPLQHVPKIEPWLLRVLSDSGRETNLTASLHHAGTRTCIRNRTMWLIPVNKHARCTSGCIAPRSGLRCNFPFRKARFGQVAFNATKLQSVSRYIDQRENAGDCLRPSWNHNQDLQTRCVLHGRLTVPANPHASSLHDVTRHTASLPCGARGPDVTREDSSKLDCAHGLVRIVSSCRAIR